MVRIDDILWAHQSAWNPCSSNQNASTRQRDTAQSTLMVQIVNILVHPCMLCDPNSNPVARSKRKRQITIWLLFCDSFAAKPGSCPAVKKGGKCEDPELTPNQIPCGESAGKTGRTPKENDWDCPGEQKCCMDPTGCLSICRHPPNGEIFKMGYLF